MLVKIILWLGGAVVVALVVYVNVWHYAVFRKLPSADQQQIQAEAERQQDYSGWG